MSSERLLEYLEGISKQIYSLQTEIGCVCSSSYEESMVETWKTLAKEYREQLEEEKATLIDRCQTTYQEIARQRALIEADQSPISGNLAPQLRARLAEAEKELADVARAVAETEDRRSGMAANIRSICAELQVAMPSLPNSLTKTAMAEWEAAESGLAEEKACREQRIREFQRVNLECERYLGIPATTIEAKLDTQAIEALNEQCNAMQDRCAARKQEVRQLESQIGALASSMEVECGIPFSGSDEGTQQRVDLLAARLKELKHQRLSMLPKLVADARKQLLSLWEESYTDEARRVCNDSKEPTEETLDSMEAQILELRTALADPLRSATVSAINVLRLVHAKEEKLQDLTHNPETLKRGGFMQNITREKLLRSEIEKMKPQAVNALKSALAAWNEDHPAETFYVNGSRISDVLARDEAAMKPVKVSLGVKRSLDAIRRVSAGSGAANTSSSGSLRSSVSKVAKSTTASAPAIGLAAARSRAKRIHPHGESPSQSQLPRSSSRPISHSTTSRPDVPVVPQSQSTRSLNVVRPASAIARRPVRASSDLRSRMAAPRPATSQPRTNRLRLATRAADTKSLSHEPCDPRLDHKKKPLSDPRKALAPIVNRSPVKHTPLVESRQERDENYNESLNTSFYQSDSIF